MKKTEKFKSNSYILPVIFLSLIILAILSSFRIRMIEDAKSRVEESYRLETNDISQLYSRNIYAMEKIANLLATEILEEEDLFDDSCIENIAVAKRATNVNNIYIVNDNYAAIDANGQTYVNINEDKKLSSIFSAKGTEGKFIKGGKGKNYLYLSRAIASKNQNRGYIIIEYVPNIMETLLNNPKYSSSNTFALVSADGDVIESAGKKSYLCEVGTNMIDKAQNVIYVDGSYSAFRQAIVDCRTGSQQTVYGDQGNYIFYSPIDNCKASVVMLVDTKDVERSFSVVSKNIRTMTMEIGIAIIAFIIIFAGIALLNKAKYNVETEDLQNKADTDLLTDLYNKVATERMIKEYLQGDGKNSVSMLFVLDVDDFKKINDTRGHAFGDQVLAQFGHQIRSWFRVNDILGRIGGDEFMIFIKDVKDPELIRHEGSRIMQFFEGFNVGEYTKYSPTASVGGAVYPTDAEDFDSLYKAADKAVYKSKKDGKNRVSFYADLNKVEKDAVIEKKED